MLELPPAPAALVLVGLALATLSARSAAAFRLIAVLGPPGGDRLRPLLTPPAGEGEPGEEGCDEDYEESVSEDVGNIPEDSKERRKITRHGITSANARLRAWLLRS